MGLNPVVNDMADTMYKGKKQASFIDPLLGRPEGEIKKSDAGPLL